MRCGFAWVLPGVLTEAAAPSPMAATPPATKMRRLIIGFPLPTLPRMRGRVGRGVAAADPSRHLQAKTDRRDMPVSCIGASSLLRHRRLVRSGDEVGTNRHAVKPIWRKNHGC